MKVKEETVWVIMSKDRKLIAKGTPRNRWLVAIDNEKDKKRYLTYSTKGKAVSAFTNNGFFGQDQIEGYERGVNPISEFLEAVECKMIFQIG